MLLTASHDAAKILGAGGNCPARATKNRNSGKHSRMEVFGAIVEQAYSNT